MYISYICVFIRKNKRKGINMQNRRWLLPVLGLLLVILCFGCEKKENEKEAYAEYPDYFREVLQELERNEKEHLWFSDNWDTGLKAYNETPEEQIPMGYVDNGNEVEAEGQCIYNIKWLKLGEGSILEDITFDLSGYQTEQKRWVHRATFFLLCSVPAEIKCNVL